MKRYFMHAHTSKGFHSLLRNVWKDSTKVFIVKGSSEKSRGNLLNEVLKFLNKEDVQVEVNVHPDNGETIDSLYIPEKSKLLIADNSPLSLSSRFPLLAVGILDLNDCLNSDKLRNQHVRLFHLIQELDHERKLATDCFAKGVSIHEKKEDIYLSAMDFCEADKVADEIISEWFNDSIEEENNPIVTKHFFGAGTCSGPINFIDSLTEDLDHRVIIKGRSGSGKSTLMRKIGREAERRSLSIDYFPCALDPNSLDMVLIPSLKMAVLDGTAPHVIDPTRKGDQVVNMFERCIDPAVEENNIDLINDIDKQYKETMKKGTRHLHRANELGDLIHKIYSDATNEKLFDEKVKDAIKLVNDY